MEKTAEIAKETETKSVKNDPFIESMFKVGAHFGLGSSRRHPSTSAFIFGSKNKAEIFDLEKTKNLLETAKNFLKSLGTEKKTILFVGGKNESKEAVKKEAMAIKMPYVAGRWIGGTLTNFGIIRGRVEKLASMNEAKESGDWTKYTKLERIKLEKELSHLNEFFSGLNILTAMPAAIVIVDPRYEETAVSEAHKVGIPIVALANSDCDIKDIDYPVIGNDASKGSIEFFISELAKAYKEGREALGK